MDADEERGVGATIRRAHSSFSCVSKLLHQLFAELLGGVVAHLSAVCSSPRFQDNGKDYAGRDGNAGKLDAENVNLLLIQPEPVIRLALDPVLRLLQGRFFSALTAPIKSAHVDYSNPAQFNIMPDYLGRAADRSLGRGALYLNRVVGNKPVGRA